VDDNGFYTTTKIIVLNNYFLSEKQMNDLQNIPLKKGGIITLNDYNYYDDSRTLEEWQSLPVSNYRFEIDNGLGGAKDAFLKLLAHNKLTTEDRKIGKNYLKSIEDYLINLEEQNILLRLINKNQYQNQNQNQNI
jgi:hypothetical protein